MKKPLHVLLALSLSLIALSSKAQFLQGALDKLGNKAGSELQKRAQAAIAKQRAKYDATDFNYALAVSDNAALYDNGFGGSELLDLAQTTLSASNGGQALPQDEARNLNNAGEVLYAKGKYKSAHGLLLSALAKYYVAGNGGASPIKLDTTPGFMTTLSNLALLYHTTGSYTLADTFSKAALRLRRQHFGNDHIGVGASLNNLAMLYKDMGRYGRAEELIDSSVAIHAANRDKYPTQYAVTLNNKAILYQTVGRYKEAEPLLKKALEIALLKYSENSSNIVRLNSNLALLYQDMERYPEAEKIYQDLIAIKKKRLGTGSADYAHLLNSLAALDELMGKTSEVEKQLLQARDIYLKKFGEQNPAYINVLDNLASFYRVSGRAAEAEKLAQKVVDVRKSILGENHPQYADAVENLALTQWAEAKFPDAAANYLQALKLFDKQIQVYFPPMSENEKARFWATLRPKYERFYSFVDSLSQTGNADPALLTQLYGEMYNRQVATKGILLSSSNKVKERILQGGDEAIKLQYKAWINDKEQLAAAYTLSKDELKERQINLDSLEQATNTTEKKLSSSSEAFSQAFDSKPVDFSQIAGKLGADEAAVEIIRFRYYNPAKPTFSLQLAYATLILKGQTNKVDGSFLPNGTLLEKRYLGAYLRAIRNKQPDSQSYGVYWQPVANRLTGVKKVYVSLDGVYNQINLGTLLISPGKYVIDQQQLRLVTNTKDVLTLKGPQKTYAQSSAFLLGYPNYGLNIAVERSTIGDLPGTKLEINGIEAILKSRAWRTESYLRDQALEQQIKKVNAPRLMHIATHGFFLQDVDDTTTTKVFGIEPSKARENPLLRSGLLLTGAEKAAQNLEDNSTDAVSSNNGVLTAYEAMSLNLEGTELVVLSACETGLGEVRAGEGVYGLQRAFQVAGARALLMSLWRVADVQTQQLMTNFYTIWLKTGDKYQAFVSAQQMLRKQYPDPYYWGAFQMLAQ